MASTLETSLIEYYKLDESGTADRVSSVSGGTTLVPTGRLGIGSTSNIDITGVPGKRNKAARLNVSNSVSGENSYLKGGSVAALSGASDFSVALWARMKTSALNVTGGTVFSTGTVTIVVTPNANVGFQISISNGGTTNNLYAGITISKDQWYFIVFMHDSTNSKLIIDVNGADRYTGNTSITPGTATTPIEIGSIFSGDIDEMGIWSKLLTDAEITTLWNNGKGVQYPFGIIPGERRVPVPTFAKSDDGHLYIARGDIPMKRWNGLDDEFVDAGVPAPTTTPVIGSSGAGAITGNLYSYVRNLDADGRVSNLSPAAALHTVAGASGSISDASNAAPIVVTTSSAHGLTTGNTVRITGVLGNYAANGEWVVTVLATTTFSLDSSLGTGEYGSGGTWRSGAGQVDYSSIEVPTDPRVVTRQIFRNKNGNANVFYLDVTDTGLTATTFTSTKTESQLGAILPLKDTDGNDLNVERHTEPPDYKRVVISHYNRLWAAVDFEYNQGASNVTNGSAAVTGIGTAWTANMAGRIFYPRGDNQSYTISSVDVPTQTLTLSAAYNGVTAVFQRYAIRPAITESRAVHFSEATLPDSWSLGANGDRRTLVIPEDIRSGEMTGLMPFSTSLYCLFQHRMYRLTYTSDPGRDGRVFLAAWRGCVNQNCWVTAEGQSYLLDSKGIYAYSGEDVQDLSQPIQVIFSGDRFRRWRVSWQNSDYWHAAHFANRQTIKWFVTLGGATYPRHAICYNYIHQRFWLEEYCVPICSSTEGVLDGRRQVFLATLGRTVLAPGGTLDGVQEQDGYLRGVVVSADSFTLTASLPLSTSVIGAPVRIVSGRGRGQCRIICDVSVNKLTVVQPWSITPDQTSKFQIGGIRAHWKSGPLRYNEIGTGETRSIEVLWEPLTNPASLVARRYEDRSAVAIKSKYARPASSGYNVQTEIDSPDLVIDESAPSGVALYELEGYNEASIQSAKRFEVELEAVTNLEPVRVEEIRLTGAKQ